MKTLLRYRWRYFDAIRRRNVTTSYHATEEEIRREHPDAQPVEGTMNMLELVGDPLANSTAPFSGSNKVTGTI